MYACKVARFDALRGCLSDVSVSCCCCCPRGQALESSCSWQTLIFVHTKGEVPYKCLTRHEAGLPRIALSDARACAVQILWALCVYVEAVSVLPQLRMMQKAKVVEKFTAHYVFALGLSRFISCAHWILQLVDGDSFLLQVRKTVSRAVNIACHTLLPPGTFAK